jgi:nicotinamidase-related amidase
MSARTLERGRAALIVIDVQEAFAKAVERFDEVAAQTAILVQGARVLGLPVLVTEQYPRGLGDTVPQVRDVLGEVERLPKTVFSAARADGFDLQGRD